jgi:NADH-quinone oxidoreductase subunit M
MLWTLQRLFLGTLPEKWKTLPDIDGRELGMLIPLAAIIIFFGIYPGPMINLTSSSINTLVDIVTKGGSLAYFGH